MDVFYFSGTGNSLHVARLLQEQIPSMRLIPIISLIDRDEILSNAKEVGFIFPIYAFTIPEIYRRFLKKLKIPQAEYIFACSTRECSERVYNQINRILKRQNKALSGQFQVVSVQNYIPVWKIADSERIQKIEDQLQPILNHIAIKIKNREPTKHLDGYWRIMTYTILPMFNLLFEKSKFFNLGNRFYTEHTCNGCGQCERICLVNRIKMANERPTWDSSITCLHCLACIHWCPSKSIQIKRTNSKKKRRYHHPQIKVKDIIDQKQENAPMNDLIQSLG